MAKILPVFLPFASCGNKCIFCDQQAISGVKAENNLISLAENQIKTWLSYGISYDELAYYGGNFAAVKRQDRDSHDLVAPVRDELWFIVAFLWLGIAFLEAPCLPGEGSIFHEPFTELFLVKIDGCIIRFADLSDRVDKWLNVFLYIVAAYLQLVGHFLSRDDRLAPLVCCWIVQTTEFHRFLLVIWGIGIDFSCIYT